VPLRCTGPIGNPSTITSASPQQNDRSHADYTRMQTHQ
jgi:hypothetical protein